MGFDMDGRGATGINVRTTRRTVFAVAPVFLALLHLPYAHAQIGADSAIIAAMSGRVSIERSGELWAITAGQPIEAGQVIVTGSDGTAQLALSDGSAVEIFPNSRVVFRANRFNLRDLLDIYLGKIRLQIQSLLPGEMPLRITSPTAVISVRGTIFEVEVDPVQETTVSVDNGTVGVRHRLIPGGEVMLQAGESLRVAAALPLTAATKPAIRLRTVGRVARAVGETLIRINAARGSSGSSGGGATPPAGGVPPSDTGSNEPKPPPGNDDEAPDSDGGPSAPPGDVLP
jgi:hypothetical protein